MLKRILLVLSLAFALGCAESAFEPSPEQLDELSTPSAILAVGPPPGVAPPGLPPPGSPEKGAGFLTSCPCWTTELIESVPWDYFNDQYGIVDLGDSVGGNGARAGSQGEEHSCKSRGPDIGDIALIITLEEVEGCMRLMRSQFPTDWSPPQGCEVECQPEA